MLAMCSFDMLFTFVVTGWEGAVHDSRVLTTQLEDPNSGFPHPPPGLYVLIFSVLFNLLTKYITSLTIFTLYTCVEKYYLVDYGYSNKPGYLASFRNIPYHLQDAWRRGGGINGPTELFNYRHASLRNCIEKCFGVLKTRFLILWYMTNFSLIRQREIAMWSCVLHNFIKLHNRDDPLFGRFGVDGVMPPPDSDDEDDAPSSSGITGNQGLYGGNDDDLANGMRDHMMFQMYLNHNI